ncbi:phenylalanine--tRNA ligase subunit beta [Mobilicoccus caccae]
MAVDLLVELGGGTADPDATDVDRTSPPQPISFDTRDPWRLVEPGEDGFVPTGLDHDSVIGHLRSIGCEVEAAGDPSDALGFSRVQVTPPTWRPDLADGPDLIEEVARLRGYERIPSILPTAPGGRGLTRGQRAHRLIGSVLAGLGLTEVWSYPFVSGAVFDALGHEADDERRRALRIANPLSDEAPLMRTSVLDSLLATLRLNLGRGAGDVALYEVGLVFLPGADPVAAPVPAVGERPEDSVLEAIQGAVPPQPRHVAWVMTGQASPAGPWGPARPVDAAEAIGVAVELGRVLGVVLRPEAAVRTPWHPGRCAALRVVGGPCDGQIIGYAGELHPKVCGAVEVPERTCAAELDLDALVLAAGESVTAAPLSTYPVARTDVALVVDEHVPAGDVEAALRSGAGESLESLVLFDVYTGDQLEHGTKSLAFRLGFRAADRTLKTGQVTALRDDAISAARKATGAELRGA